MLASGFHITRVWSWILDQKSTPKLDVTELMLKGKPLRKFPLSTVKSVRLCTCTILHSDLEQLHFSLSTKLSSFTIQLYSVTNERKTTLSIKLSQLFEERFWHIFKINDIRAKWNEAEWGEYLQDGAARRVWTQWWVQLISYTELKLTANNLLSHMQLLPHSARKWMRKTLAQTEQRLK